MHGVEMRVHVYTNTRQRSSKFSQGTPICFAEVISDGRLMELSGNIQDEWKSLGIKLNMTYNDLRQIEAQYPTDARARNMAMLTSWRNRLPLNNQLISLGQLASGLLEVGRRDLTKYTDI